MVKCSLLAQVPNPESGHKNTEFDQVAGQASDEQSVGGRSEQSVGEQGTLLERRALGGREEHSRLERIARVILWGLLSTKALIQR